MEQKFKIGKDCIGVGIGIMIMRDEKVLLGQRHPDPMKADSELSGEGTWTMPGGKLDFGETFEEGVKRETKEETNIDLNIFEAISVNNEIKNGIHFVTIGFYSDDFKGEAEIMEPDEITKWEWFDLNNLPSPLFFPSAKLIENYKQKKFYIKELTSLNSHN
jgi:8-oxo-dGTP diphosphatase